MASVHPISVFHYSHKPVQSCKIYICLLNCPSLYLDSMFFLVLSPQAFYLTAYTDPRSLELLLSSIFRYFTVLYSHHPFLMYCYLPHACMHVLYCLLSSTVAICSQVQYCVLYCASKVSILRYSTVYCSVLFSRHIKVLYCAISRTLILHIMEIY